MMWMSGSQIHLFSIMMLVTGIYQPLSSLFNVRQGEQLAYVKSVAAAVLSLLDNFMPCVLNVAKFMQNFDLTIPQASFIKDGMMSTCSMHVRPSLHCESFCVCTLHRTLYLQSCIDTVAPVCKSCILL